MGFICWMMTNDLLSCVYQSPHNQRHAACLILLSVDVSVPLLWLCNQKTTWLLKAESPVYAAFTIQLCSQTIGFCSGVWEFNSQDTSVSIVTTNKKQCLPSWCLPVPSPGSATTGQPGGICFRHSSHFNWLILMQRSSNFTDPCGRPNCSPLHWQEPWPDFARFLPLPVIRRRLWARYIKVCSEC